MGFEQKIHPLQFFLMHSYQLRGANNGLLEGVDPKLRLRTANKHPLGEDCE